MATADWITFIGVVASAWAGGVLINFLADVLPAEASQPPGIRQFPDNRQQFFSNFPWPRKKAGFWKQLRAWTVALLPALLAIWLWRNPSSHFGFPLEFLTGLFFSLVVVIDIEHHRIPLPANLGGLLIALAALWQQGFPLQGWLGGLTGLLLSLLFFAGGKMFNYFFLPRQKTRHEPAVGFGDILFGAVLGLFTGWPGILECLWIALLLAGLASLVTLIYQWIRNQYQPGYILPLSPFLVLGALWVLA
jgi:prepilin signal peptidase PulO-like enzyme (type II secretory pathway)